MSRKKLLIVGVIAALVAIGIAVVVAVKRNNRMVVQTSRVERRGVLASKVSASGEIRAKMSVDVQAEVAGVIKEVYVKEGDEVKAGDKLLSIDPIQTEAEKKIAEAQLQAAMAEAKGQEAQIATAEVNYKRDEFMLRSARAELEQAQTQLARIRNSFERKKQLFEQNLLSREEFDIAQAELRAAQAQLDASRARVAQAEAQVKATRHVIEQMRASHRASLGRVEQARARLMQAQDQLIKTIVYAPISGIITKLNVEKGERAVPGLMFNPQATLMTIADMSIVEVELKVDETDIVNVALGNEAKVTVDALPNRPIPGRVTEIGNSPIDKISGQASSGAQEGKDFKVIVQLEDPPRELRPGLSATAEITTATKRNVLVIPLQAVTVREVEVDERGDYVPPDPNRKGVSADAARKVRKKELQGVFVVDKDRRARFRPIKTGLMGEMDIEVVEGLSEGEEIISGSYKTLRTITDGTPVKVDNLAVAREK